MKYRILKHMGDKFEVQRKLHWWSFWQSRAEYDETGVLIKKYYSNIEAAKAAVRVYQPKTKPIVIS